jgi:predicted Rossmann-fold nucleotide-binding protein
MRRLCVFCGSAVGAAPPTRTPPRGRARRSSRADRARLRRRRRSGSWASSPTPCSTAGGEVVGVIPRPLAHEGDRARRLHRAPHRRHDARAEGAHGRLSDGFLALPGGLGTFEELLEMLTWTQLGVHAKPVGALDVGGYWTGSGGS